MWFVLAMLLLVNEIGGMKFVQSDQFYNCDIAYTYNLHCKAELKANSVELTGGCMALAKMALETKDMFTGERFAL
ncbi:hypothetical protein FRX31_025382 [Thalictrum thalictroides]|uniref:Uncharacterized protein n=1 Tax=Thalictrum thalictroides TaxID=46969 RepID=A0A7J6VIV2_THATH|nr:hypothetical protein FRX31_025382 [Thalictrum thalictroides]